MLRITACPPQHPTPTLKLEGKLLGPWVDELQQACATTAAPLCQVCLDLSAVSYVDGAGVALLRDLQRRGVRLTSCSGFIAELLHRESR